MIDPQSTQMFIEAGEAPHAVARQHAANAGVIAGLAQTLRGTDLSAVVTCARGSSDHAATYAKYLIETRAGILTTSVAPSIASVYDGLVVRPDMLAIAISQSGRSPDILASLDAARRAGARTLALVNAPDSPLENLAETVIPLHAGPEISVAATKSFIATIAAIIDLTAAWTDDGDLAAALADAPEQLDQAWAADWTALVGGLTGVKGLYVLGRGMGLGIAQEAALKFKETCGLHAEAFSAAEFRHGPMALVGPEFPLLVFRQSDEAGDSIEPLIADIVARGDPVFVAGTEIAGTTTLPVADSHPVIQPMLAIQSFYRAVNALSVLRGHDPDRPRHLAKVTETV